MLGPGGEETDLLSRLGRLDRLLLAVGVPLAVLASALHIQEIAHSGLAQLPVYATPSHDGSPYPRVGGYRMETDSSGTELQPGDRLLRVGDRDLAGAGYIGFDAIGLAVAGTRGAPVVYERDGVRRTGELRAEPHLHPWTRIPTMLLMPICVLVLLHGSRDARRFFLAFMSYLVVQAQFYGGPEWKTWTSLLIWNLGTPVAVVLVLRWVAMFPEELPPERRAWWGWPWLAGAIYVALRLNFLTGHPIPVHEVQRVSHGLHALYLLATIALLARNLFYADPIGRRRIKWILYGATVGSVPMIVTQVLPLLTPGWQGFELGFAVSVLATVLWLVCVVVAVVRFNAFDIDRLIGATAAYSAVAVVLLGVLLSGVPALADATSPWLGVDAQSARLGLSVVLALLVVPTAARLRPQVDRLFFPERVALQRGVDALLFELSHCASAAEVVRKVGEGVTALLSPRGFAAYTRAGGGLRRASAEGLALPEVLAADPALAAGEAPWRLPEGSALAEAGAVLALPLHRAEVRAALLFLGPKRSGDVYSSTDVALLAAVCQKASAELLRFRLHQERRRASALRTQKEEADQESRIKSRLLATASHDIRQPLHALSLLVERLGSRVNGGAAGPDRDLVEKIQRSTQDLTATLETLLDLSRVEAGTLEPEIEDVALDPLLDQLEAEFGEQARRRGLRLRVRRCGLAVRSDRVLLARILRNLVSNALRYTDDGGVLVGVRPGGETLRVQVVDTGRGIATADRERIFQEFRRAGNGGAAEGLGLGLAIVDGLVQLLGHELRLRSVLGRGSTFEVRVPRAALARDAGRLGAQLAPAGAAGLEGRRVAIVDDDASVCDATSALLRDWGCEVRTATSAEEAWQRLAGPDWTPDFLLSDQHLGERETGAELIRSMRERLGRALPAALITAETAPDRMRALRATGLLVLKKPVPPARLRALLTQLLAAEGVTGGATPSP